MTQRPVGVTDTAAGPGVAEVRTRERTVDTVAVAEQYVIPVDERVPTFRGAAATFRMVGSAATPQWLWQIQNAVGTNVLVAVRSVVVTHDHFGATASTVVNGVFSLGRSTGTRAGGTALTLSSVGLGEDAVQTSHANVTMVGGASADGTNSLITGLTAGGHMSRRMGNRAHTLVGQILPWPLELVPPPLAKDGIVLRSGDQLAAIVEHAAAANNIVGFAYTVSVLWDEYTLP
jgi:hypothetical protein